MRFKQKLLLLLLLMFSMYGVASANDTVVIDDIAYLLDSSTKEAEVTLNPNLRYSNLIVPSHVTYEGEEYTVVSIKLTSLSATENMGTVVIPNTVRTIADNCFSYVRNIENLVIEDGDTPIYLGRHTSYSTSKSYGPFSGATIEQVYLGRNCTIHPRDDGSPLSFGGVVKSVTFGDGVTEVAPNLFEIQFDLTEVVWNKNITKVGDNAFFHCPKLTDVVITSPVDTIGNSAFAETYFSYDEPLVKISQLPETLKYIGDEAFAYLKGDMDIPESVEYIGDEAFRRTEITTVTLSSNLKHLGKDAFMDCQKLTEVTLPENLKRLNNGVFSYCTSLSKINIPWGLEELGSKCFFGTKLEEIIIPPSTKLLEKENTFSSISSLKKLVYWAPGLLGKNNLPSFNNDLEIWLKEPSYSDLWSNPGVKAFPCRRINKKEYLYGYKFDLIYFYPGAEIQSIDVYLEGEKVRTIPVNSENQYFIKNLIPDNYYYTVLHFTADGHESTDSVQFKTEDVSISYFNGQYTQRTITVPMPRLDESIENIMAIGYSLDDGEIVWRNPDELRTTPMFTELTPDTEYKLTCYIKVADLDEPILVDSFTAKTLSAVGREKKEVGPTSIRLTFEKCTGDDYVTYERIKYKLPGSSSFKEVSSNTLELKDLKPNSKIEYEYWGHLNSDPITGWSVQLYKLQSGTITTDALTLKTLPVKIVNKGEVIVAASTNAWDIDENLSFMWGKNDAPAGMQFPEAKAVVCDGQIEGYISNLSDTYYKVCAKYTFTDGTYMTSDWVIFDPTEFSFFTPTIREYDATEVSEKNATLRAYVMRGSEEILEQGFEYHTETSSRIMRRSASRAEGAWDTDDVVKVFGSSQVMTVELTDLKPGTNYVARAFVTTASGTDYGNEIRFKTTGTPEAAVEAVEAEDSEVTVKAIYDINGRRLSEPQKGINIVIMSDGSARKIVK